VLATSARDKRPGHVGSGNVFRAAQRASQTNG
jgi:hypothetical protein